MTDTPPKVVKKKAPPKDEPKTKEDTKPRAVRGPTRTLKDKLEMFFAQIGLAVSVVDPLSGQIIVGDSEELALAWYNLAQQNPKVKATLENMMSGGAWGGAILATVGTGYKIAMVHGVAPAMRIPGFEGPNGTSPEPGMG